MRKGKPFSTEAGVREINFLKFTGENNIHVDTPKETRITDPSLYVLDNFLYINLSGKPLSATAKRMLFDGRNFRLFHIDTAEKLIELFKGIDPNRF